MTASPVVSSLNRKGYNSFPTRLCPRRNKIAVMSLRPRRSILQDVLYSHVTRHCFPRPSLRTSMAPRSSLLYVATSAAMSASTRAAALSTRLTAPSTVRSRSVSSSRAIKKT